MAWQLGSAGDVSAQLGLPSVSLCGTMACVQAVGSGPMSPGGGGGLRRAHRFIRDAVSFRHSSGNVYDRATGQQATRTAYKLDRFSGVQSFHQTWPRSTPPTADPVSLSPRRCWSLGDCKRWSSWVVFRTL